MRKLVLILGVAAACMGVSGCAYVTSANPGLTVATGESWYTKDKFFLFIPLGTDIYYCPETGKTCYVADIQ